MVSEKWVKDSEENWHVDQWLFYVAKSGSLKSYIMQEIIKYKNGSNEVNKLKTSKSQAISVFEEKKNMWLNN